MFDSAVYSALDRLVDAAHSNAVSHGWWDEDRCFAEQVALFHTEISEALEEYRNGHYIPEIYFVTDKEGRKKPEGVPIELADVLIRIFDTCGKYSIDLANALELKMKYNVGRPYKHGGKVI